MLKYHRHFLRSQDNFTKWRTSNEIRQKLLSPLPLVTIPQIHSSLNLNLINLLAKLVLVTKLDLAR